MKLKQQIITACTCIVLLSACSSTPTETETAPKVTANPKLDQYKSTNAEAIAEYEFANKHAQKYEDLIFKITQQGKKTNWPEYTLSVEVGKKMSDIIDKYSGGGQEKEFASDLLKLTANSAFDQAYIDQLVGKLYASAGDLTAGIPYLERSTESFILGKDTFIGALKVLGVLNISIENYEKGLEHYYDYIRYQGFAEPAVYTHLALAHYKQEEFILAAMAAQKAMDPDPKASNDAQLKMQFSAWQELDMHYNSLLAVHQQHEYAPKSDLYLNNLANLYNLVEDHNNTIKYRLLSYEFGAEKTMSNQRQLSRAYSFINQHETALQIFESCKQQKICSDKTKNQEHSAFLQMQAGNSESAANQYQTLFEHTQDYKYLNNIAAMYLKQQDLSKTKSAIEQALKNPTSDETKYFSYKLLAELHILQKNYQLAESALQKIPTESVYFEQVKELIHKATEQVNTLTNAAI